MAGPDVEDLHRRIEDGSALENPFKLLRDVAHAYALATAGAIDRSDRALLTARELVIRLLAHRDRLGSAVALHDALVARLGLYAYLTETRLKGPELLAYEMHRPLGDFGEEMVWHRTQAVAYAHLLDGKSVILSAPTSFGKSRVIDGLVATGRYTDLLIIVPTVALIDEARRRLTRLAGDGYKVVTHSSQSPGERTIYVLTQERVLEFDQLPKIDLWVLDEFYKLALEEDADRTRLLNHAFYKLLQTGAPFYLLGPNIGGIGEPTLSQLDCVWIDSWDTTVAVDVIPIPKGGKKDDRLLGVCSQCVERNERGLVYCSGPNTAERVGE